MKGEKIYLGLILAVLGLIGTASLITMDFPLSAEIEVVLKESFTPVQIKLLLLINPSCNNSELSIIYRLLLYLL